MKTIASIISMFFLACILLAGIPDNSQVQREVSVKPSAQDNGISFVRAHRQGKGITVTWGSSISADVNFSVEKTYFDPTDIYSEWETVASMPCDGSRSYKCNDNAVYPGFVNYRVAARGNDGSVIYSETVTVRIVSR
jgi:hypothetical protein